MCRSFLILCVCPLVYAVAAVVSVAISCALAVPFICLVHGTGLVDR